MVSCAAPNCRNKSSGPSRKRCFRFPSEKHRRKYWINNCGRDPWIPGPGARLCEMHFDENQFEASGKDGWRKLKKTAIPTLFNLLNRPQRVESGLIKDMHHLETLIAIRDLARADSAKDNTPEILPDDIEKELSNVNSAEVDPCEIDAANYVSPELDDDRITASPLPLPSPSTPLYLNGHYIREQKKLCFDKGKKELCHLANTTLQIPAKIEDEFDVVGKRIAFQLRAMGEHQRLVAEKLIADIMFQGRLERLTEHASLRLSLPSIQSYCTPISTVGLSTNIETAPS